MSPPTARGPLRFDLPAQEGDEAVLHLVSPGWQPAEMFPGNGDTRTLGVKVQGIIVTADGADDRTLVNANTGQTYQVPSE